MKLYWIKTHSFIKKIFKNFVWDIPNYENKIFLTFDDGPTPEITNWVLDELKKYNAKATFFCIGNNIQKYPEIYQNLIEDGHSVGNHTFDHLNGWKNNAEKYIKNVLLAENFINAQPKLFRPPYGKIKTFQANKLRKLGYKIIMWDVLSADFDNEITPEKYLQNVLSNIKSGSIIVFHDSQKASKNLKYVFPKTLEFLSKNNFICEVIS